VDAQLGGRGDGGGEGRSDEPLPPGSAARGAATGGLWPVVLVLLALRRGGALTGFSDAFFYYYKASERRSLG
jgi:hypothetical protein